MQKHVMCSKQPTGVSASEEGKLRGQARAFTDIIVGRIVVQAEAQDVAHVLSGEGTGLLDLNPLSTFKLTETMASLYYPVTLCWLVKAKVRVDGIDGTQIRLLEDLMLPSCAVNPIYASRVACDAGKD